MLFLLYERSVFGRLMMDEEELRPSVAVSFWPEAMTIDQVREFTECTQMPIVRLRGYYINNQHNDLLCRGRGQALYTVNLPHHLLLSRDNLGGVDDAYMAYGDLVLDLYQQQESILREMPQ